MASNGVSRSGRGAPMRIAVWHNLPSGGSKRALYNHVRGLIDQGHYVEAWAPSTIDRDFLPLDGLIRETVVPLDYPYRWSDKYQLTLHVNRVIAAMEEHARICARQIAAGSFDLLFANTCGIFASPAIGRHVDLPSVLYLGEPCRSLYEAMPEPIWAAPPRRGRWPSLDDLRHRFVDHRRLRNARIQMREEIRNAGAYDRILCNSYFSRDSIKRAYGMDAEVCYLGVNEDQFAYGAGARGDFVLSLGSFTWAKNPRLSLQAIARMNAPRPPLIWVANVVDEALLAEMRQFAEDEGVDLEVRVNVTDAELVDMLATAAVLLYTPRLEPFGLAAIEAGACGTPVVGVPEGGLRETVIDGVNGILAQADPDALAAALESVIRNPDFARELGRNGRHLAETKWSHRLATGRFIAKIGEVAGTLSGDVNGARLLAPAIALTAMSYLPNIAI
jgi:glycosyltransferase involved in cell wall biosynthesis